MIWNRNSNKKRIRILLKNKGYSKSLFFNKFGISSKDLKTIFKCNSHGLDVLLKHLNSSIDEIDVLNNLNSFNYLELSERKLNLETKIEILDNLLDIY